MRTVSAEKLVTHAVVGPILSEEICKPAGTNVPKDP